MTIIPFLEVEICLFYRSIQVLSAFIDVLHVRKLNILIHSSGDFTEYMNQLLIICPLVFFAGFVDSIAGGGGIISLPAYVAAGLPYHMALGTNKFASSLGTSVATARFIKNGKVHFKAAAVSVPAALFGSWIGARLALKISEVYLQYTLIITLPFLAVFLLRSGKFKNEELKKNITGAAVLALSAAAGFVVGMYDGFFGPGTGTFLILIYNAVIGFDILTSSGNAKVINLSSNVAALATFLASGNVVVPIGACAAVFGIAGNYVGSGLAIKKGIKLIRPVFILVLAILTLKILYDVITSR